MKTKTKKRGAENASRPSNVYDIGDNPKFKKKRNWIAIPNNTQAQADDLFAHTVTKFHFGFVPGDTIICRPRFNKKEFTPNTIIVCQTKDGLKHLTTFASVGKAKILAVVIAYRREVSL